MPAPYQTRVYHNSRPVFSVEKGLTKYVDSSRNTCIYIVTSRYLMTDDELIALHSLRKGILGYGTSCRVLSRSDEPTGYDEVPCVETDPDTGFIISQNALNPGTGQPYTPMRMPYYVYRVEDIIDKRLL